MGWLILQCNQLACAQLPAMDNEAQKESMVEAMDNEARGAGGLASSKTLAKVDSAGQCGQPLKSAKCRPPGLKRRFMHGF